MKKIILAAAAVLTLGTSIASAATNYVETPHGFYTYQGSGLGNAPNQAGG